MVSNDRRPYDDIEENEFIVLAYVKNPHQNPCKIIKLARDDAQSKWFVALERQIKSEEPTDVYNLFTVIGNHVLLITDPIIMIFDSNLKAIENFHVRETSPYIQWYMVGEKMEIWET